MTTQEQKLKSSIFFVEATDYEQLCLWQKYHTKTEWEEDSGGHMETIGYINEQENNPVCVVFSFAKLYGKRICFYYASSRLVDHDMVEDYIEKTYPVTYDNGTRRAMTDAQNFHTAIHECERKVVEMNEEIKIGEIVPNSVTSWFDGGSISTNLGSTYFTQLFDDELKKYQDKKYEFSDVCRNEHEYKAFYGALERSLKHDGYILVVKT